MRLYIVYTKIVCINFNVDRMNSKLVSIIIPVFNSEDYIKKCLGSCFSQTYSEIEIIVINDGSTDGTKGELDDLLRFEKRLQVIHVENQGVTAARKVGVGKSNGNWLFFVDSDDTIPSYAIEHLMLKASTTAADIVVGDYNYLDEEHFLIKVQTNKVEKGIIESALSYNLTCNLWGRLIERKLIENIEWPSYSIKIGEDIICGIQLLINSKKTVLLNESVYDYIQYKNSTINSHNPVKVASMIPYLCWMDDFFEKRKLYRKNADFFILNEYFKYLMFGGNWGEYNRFKMVFDKYAHEQPFKIKIIFSPFRQLFIIAARRLFFSGCTAASMICRMRKRYRV